MVSSSCLNDLVRSAFQRNAQKFELAISKIAFFRYVTTTARHRNNGLHNTLKAKIPRAFISRFNLFSQLADFSGGQSDNSPVLVRQWGYGYSPDDTPLIRSSGTTG